MCNFKQDDVAYLDDLILEKKEVVYFWFMSIKI